MGSFLPIHGEPLQRGSPRLGIQTAAGMCRLQPQRRSRAAFSTFHLEGILAMEHQLDVQRNKDLAGQLDAYAASLRANTAGWKERLPGCTPYAAAVGSGL